MTETPQLAKSRWGTLGIVCLSLATLVLCGLLTLRSMFTGITGYPEPANLESLNRAISAITDTLASNLLIGLLSIAILAAIAVWAAWLRSARWCWAALVAALLIGITICSQTWSLQTRLAEEVDQRDSFIADLRAAADRFDMDGGGDDAAPVAEPWVPTYAEGSAEMVRLAGITAAASAGPVQVVSVTDADTSSDPEHRELLDQDQPQISVTSCTRADNTRGQAATLLLDVPSDEDERAVRQQLLAFADAGYTETNQMRSERFLSSTAHPEIHLSVNDRFTITGTLAVRIESDCLADAE